MSQELHRGVDPREVRSFSTGLADELKGIQTQVVVLTQETLRRAA